MDTKYTIEAINKHRVIAIIRGAELHMISDIALALLNGGIQLMEVTFDQKRSDDLKETSRAIAQIDNEFGDQVKLGAGTVINREQLDAAHESGASFIISPVFDQDIVQETKNKNMVSIPGCFSPTEMIKAHEAGADFIKIFPAGTLGADYIKAVMAPLAHIKTIAVGGVDHKNMTDFIKAGVVGLGIGGSIVSKIAIENKDFKIITDTARIVINKIAQIATD